MISTLNSNTNRISGLASGLETEELIKQLTAATNSKIEKAEQQKQVLEWKQEYYREISTKLVDFNEKYFGTSITNTLIGDSLTKPEATSSNPTYVTASTGSSSESKEVYISDILSLASASKYQSLSPISPDLSFTVSLDQLSELSGKSMNVTLDGVTKTITFGEGSYTSSEDVAAALGGLLSDAFGEGRINVSGADGKLTLTSQNSIVTIGNSGIIDAEALSTLGFTDADISSNRLSISSPISSYSSLFGASGPVSFSINDINFSFDESTSISKIISTVNASDANVKMSYSNISDTFTIVSKETGTGSNITLADQEGGFLNGILGGTGTFTTGTNAIVTLSLDGSTNEDNFITITRNSNSFSLEGTTYTLNGMASGVEQESVTVAISLDTDKIVDKITEFVNDYNELLGFITDKLTEEYNRNYQPLTSTEKETLTDSEIEALTNKAKTGLLRNDIYLSKITNSLRSSLYMPVKKNDGSGENINYILADIGITTSAYTEKGKLKIDENKLRSVLSKDADGVLNLLTQQSSVGYSVYNTTAKAEQRYDESGLLWRISDIIKTNLNSVGKKGTLIQLAGNPSTGFVGETTYSKKINEITTTIDKLKSKLMDQEDYYWSKFSAMETSLSSLNSQSIWMTEQFSS